MPLRGAVYVNGTIAPAEHAVVPVYDHGFLYGEGVYETLRTYNQAPFLFDRHARRLRASADRLRLLVPFDNEALRVWIQDTIAAAGELEEAYIRVLLTRGVGELTYDIDATPAPSLVIIVKPLEEVPARIERDGISISLVPVLRNHPGSVNPIIKSNNLLNNAIAMQQANQRGGEEALMCNYRGELSECSQSNFFMVREGVLLTPPSDAGLLEGITRAFLLDLAREAGIEAREQTLYPHDLDTADEVFITSTTRELSPVVRIDDHVIANGTPGPITLDLLTRYRRYAWESTANGAGAIQDPLSANASIGGQAQIKLRSP
jgi:branched-chain amino acid aminotransferase